MIRLVHIILGLIAELFNTILGMIGDGIVEAVPSRRKEGYDADFGKLRDVLVKDGGGFYIGCDYSTGVKASHEHLICLGGSGTKKSTALVHTTILNENNASMVIHDPSKQTLSTAEAKKREGYTVLVLDYLNPERSEGINMLALCKTQADIYKVAEVNVKNAIERVSEDFWTESAITMIVLFAKYLLKYAEQQYINLHNVLHLINIFSYKPQAIDKLLVATGDKQLLSEYKSLVALPDRTLLSVVATAKTALSVYADPQVQKVTSFNSIDFSKFTTERTILYICHSAPMADYYRSVTATFFEMFWAHLLEDVPEESGDTYPVYFLIDEASSMKLTSLPQTVALARKHAVSIMLLFQDYNQLEHLYGKYNAANIFANTATRVFMKNQPIETCRMIESIMGKYQYTDAEGVTRTRELLTASEIRQLDKTIVASSNKPIVLLKPRAFFENKRLRELTSLPLYTPERKLPFDTPPLLPIET